MSKVGIVGLGRMGSALALRLLSAGYQLVVWNRTAARAHPLVAQGAHSAPTPRALAESCDIVLTILTDDDAVLQVYEGPEGLLSGAVPGRLFVEMSTIRTKTIERLAPQAAERGAALLDSPVSGTVAPAREGRLLALVGGAEADVDRARPVLESFCRRVAHVGPVGSGTTMKLVLNMPMAIYWQGLAEALAMGSQAGLELSTMLDLIADSPAALAVLRAKIPLILGEAGEVGFDVTGVRKDLLAMIETGQSLGVPMPAGSAALAGFMAATAAGSGREDLAAVVSYYIDAVRRTSGQG